MKGILFGGHLVALFLVLIYTILMGLATGNGVQVQEQEFDVPLLSVGMKDGESLVKCSGPTISNLTVTQCKSQEDCERQLECIDKTNKKCSEGRQGKRRSRSIVKSGVPCESGTMKTQSKCLVVKWPFEQGVINCSTESGQRITDLL